MDDEHFTLEKPVKVKVTKFISVKLHVKSNS